MLTGLFLLLGALGRLTVTALVGLAGLQGLATGTTHHLRSGSRTRTRTRARHLSTETGELKRGCRGLGPTFGTRTVSPTPESCCLEYVSTSGDGRSSGPNGFHGNGTGGTG